MTGAEAEWPNKDSSKALNSSFGIRWLQYEPVQQEVHTWKYKEQDK